MHLSVSVYGHEEVSALSDDRIWNAFENGLRLAKEGYLDERLLLEGADGFEFVGGVCEC